MTDGEIKTFMERMEEIGDDWEECLKYIQMLLYGPSLPYSGTISYL